jgi:indole-3-glycerol phosphate synthase
MPELEQYPTYSAPRRSLEEALRRPGMQIIAELKKASPSKGVIRSDFNVADLAQSYQANGAAALSVLTEPDYFQGSLDYLPIVRRCTSVPLLRKDFIVDPYQLIEARAYGADAVLLIAAVLDRTQLFDLHQTADELGLDCLVELYELEELDKLDLDQVHIVGVNNRDLRTFNVDIDHSLRVFSHVPSSLVRVSESGLRTPEDLQYLHHAGIDAVLIGESFMRQPDPGAELNHLLKNLINEVNTE